MSVSYESESTLQPEEIERYSRQILLPENGANRCARLLSQRVLVVGAGGLGSTCCLYIASGGCEELGIVDPDVVEMSNLHRQVIHTQARAGQYKAHSAAESCRAMNPSITITPYVAAFNATNALDLVSSYDIVCDCTDNVASRYLISDACVIAGKPLVSGSAVRWEGQLTVYNYRGGPCYRCMFPEPPPRNTVMGCGDVGVMGPVPGMIGCLQALEVQKIGMEPVTASGESNVVMAGRMLMFNGLTGVYRVAKLRPRNPQCISCGDHPSITPDKPLPEYVEYLKCEVPTPLPTELNIAPRDILPINPTTIRVLDVRNKIQFGMCRLPYPNVVNVPLEEIEEPEKVDLIRRLVSESEPVYVLCRRGIRSSKAVEVLTQKHGLQNLKNVEGGLTKWSKDVDSAFPKY